MLISWSTPGGSVIHVPSENGAACDVALGKDGEWHFGLEGDAGGLGMSRCGRCKWPPKEEI